MAKKTLVTRQKLVFRQEKKPRNPFALAARQRNAGSHRVTASALRAQHKRSLKKLIEQE